MGDRGIKNTGSITKVIFSDDKSWPAKCGARLDSAASRFEHENMCAECRAIYRARTVKKAVSLRPMN
jgi:hypothetical protein